MLQPPGTMLLVPCAQAGLSALTNVMDFRIAPIV